ncbi:asparagine synthase (glutamine-hydrolyzing) [Pseudodesulfovibrio sp. JC047]|uniref:asparagine synthase (glutamine-hydrolyzing) n=1 Tax=Pseudodesulfovibrio sp. JC047 TaxID=2683199 RepID=UPI0013D4C6B6|nr:asparagine synthase (glutamine-hydrolyzing) [Pseudodesulfovibrio sp. JC047]NDV19827.1 asparagine synthase (glutamine-hydrolyzing) [Pseudodesulfovibrio sp. JC047]
MCGYGGCVWKNGITPSYAENMTSKMGKQLQHRGPDDVGTVIGAGFSVVHRRLAIIDIASGQQPMFSDDRQVGIAYNGEIYNYQELRIKLEAKGFTFKTNSDTEVFLALFLSDGYDSFDQLNGMFTAFIWDFRAGSEGEFHLVRDHLGVKPLYVYEDDEKILFSSELRAIINAERVDLEPNVEGLASYFTYRYCHAPYTLYRNIRRVEAGTFLRIRHGKVSNWCYWDIPASMETDISVQEAASELRQLLKDSVQGQLMSEVPVGCFLSGGLDSSAVAVLCSELGAKLLSFNIGFPDLNEFEFSNRVAEKYELPHLTIETTPAEIAERFERVVSAMDDPIADPACFPLHILCDYVKQHVTVVLSGEGSDEMLGGYPQYKRTLDRIPDSSGTLFDHFREYSWYFNRRVLPLSESVAPYSLWGHKKYFTERPVLEGMLTYDMKTWFPENLMAKADKILMSQSLEGRFPFVSKKIVEFMGRLPEECKINNNGEKYILRKAFEKDLPKSVLTRPKMGFSVPVSDMVTEMKDTVYDLLNTSRRGRFENVLDHNVLEQTFNDHYSGKYTDPLWVWTCLVLLQWVESN